MWFDFKPRSTGEDEEELSLLLKKITTLQTLKSQSPNLYPKKETCYFGSKSLPIFFPNYKGSFYIRNKVYNGQRYLFLKKNKIS